MSGTPDLFAEAEQGAALPLVLPDAELTLFKGFYPQQQADVLLAQLTAEIHWQQENIKMYGKVHAVPRLSAWYGEAGKTYTYSGITAHAQPWTPLLLDIKQRLEAVSGIVFNSVLLNRYRSGADGVAWHSDDEPELGQRPVIGSLSLGETRDFDLRHKTRQPACKHRIALGHGDYLLMAGATQQHWQHQVPKSKKVLGERLNLTFRVIQPVHK